MKKRLTISTAFLLSAGMIFASPAATVLADPAAGTDNQETTQAEDLSAPRITNTVDTKNGTVQYMYRLYNPNSGEHFYTASETERRNVIEAGWKDEGVGWIAPKHSSTPVYRLYNKNGGEHHYTTKKSELNMLVRAGWEYEKIGWYSDDAKTVPVYRQYNPNAFSNNHNYTAKEAEKNNLVSIGWKDEGIGWYGVMEQRNPIKILYTNDVHCGIEDNLGYAGLTEIKKQVRKTTGYVTLADAGDAIQGAPIGTISKGEYITDIMNQVGYDIAVPGNHEFDYGMDQFLKTIVPKFQAKRADGTSGKYISCNFVTLADDQSVLDSYEIISYGNTQVAYVGVSTPESITKSTPSYFQDGNGEYVYGFEEDMDGTKLYNKVQSSVDEARSKGADYVILVGHLGENGTTERWSGQSIIENTDGIDAVIDGHSHETIEGETFRNKDGEEVLLTQTGTKLANVGEMTIDDKGVITTDLISSVSAQPGEKDVVVTDKGIARDKTTNDYIQSIKAKYEGQLQQKVGATNYDLLAKNTDGSWLVRNGETNLGDFLADALRSDGGTDVAIMNGGGIRANLAKGDITYEDVMTVFPWGNMVCSMNVTGQQIQDALEMGAKNYPSNSGGFLQVSGLTYTIDSSVPSHVVLDEKGNFVKVDGEYRVKDIKVVKDDGTVEDLDLAKTYSLTGINYTIKSGGDGMTMFSGAEITRDDFEVDSDAISNYIRKLGGTIGDEYKASQGRITIR